MGQANLNKDPNARIFLTLKNRIHFAGQMVEGAVHIQCLEDCPVYNFINLRMLGVEEIMWTQYHSHGQHGGHVQVQKGRKETYIVEFKLAEIAGGQGLTRGQYTYPFSFLLPANLPSSMYIDDSNFIKYTLDAVLPNFADLSYAQAFRLNFHVRQPQRGIPPMIKGEATSESFCCNCCCSCGMCSLMFQADVSYLQTNQIFNLKGTVDTSLSKAQIKSIKVLLYQNYTRVADFGRVDQKSNHTYIYDSVKKVPTGMTESFTAEVRVPPEVVGYTAIGNIFSRHYFLTLEAQTFCCYSNPRAECHVFMTSSVEPQYEQNEEVQPPADWNPMVMPLKVLTDLPVYKYMPSVAIQPINQKMGEVVNMNQEMTMNTMV